MFRIASVTVAVFCGILLIPALLTAQDGQIKDYKGQAIGDRATIVKVLHSARASGLPTPVSGAVATVPVNLKEGQKITFSVVLAGEERKVALLLLDSSSAVVKGTTAEQKSAQLEIKEAPVTGRYVLVLLSDKIGGFTLNATGPADKEPTVKEIEEEIKQLEDKLEKAKARLKAKKSKSANPSDR